MVDFVIADAVVPVYIHVSWVTNPAVYCCSFIHLIDIVTKVICVLLAVHGCTGIVNFS
jgi:hypothetical protein